MYDVPTGELDLYFTEVSGRDKSAVFDFLTQNAKLLAFKNELLKLTSFENSFSAFPNGGLAAKSHEAKTQFEGSTGSYSSLLAYP